MAFQLPMHSEEKSEKLMPLELYHLSKSGALTQRLQNESSMSPEWESLAHFALACYDIKTALCIHRRFENISMVILLQDIADIWDKNQLSGRLSVILGDFNAAQVRS